MKPTPRTADHTAAHSAHSNRATRPTLRKSLFPAFSSMTAQNTQRDSQNAKAKLRSSSPISSHPQFPMSRKFFSFTTVSLFCSNMTTALQLPITSIFTALSTITPASATDIQTRLYIFSQSSVSPRTSANQESSITTGIS